MPYGVARELIESKVRDLNQKIDLILTKWNQTDIEAFQDGVRRGEIPEAETDAIIIGNLAGKLEKYNQLLQNLWEISYGKLGTKINWSSLSTLDILSSHISSELIDLEGEFLKVAFNNGTILYVTYNKVGEYSYQYIYSYKKYDRERFDNYDKKWNIKTHPHHFHPR